MQWNKYLVQKISLLFSLNVRERFCPQGNFFIYIIFFCKQRIKNLCDICVSWSGVIKFNSIQNIHGYQGRLLWIPEAIFTKKMCSVQHSRWERPETRGWGEHIMKKQMHIFGKWGVRGPSCSPWQEDKMAPFSPHFYWHKSHEINRIKLYWGVWSAHHQEEVKLRLCC